MGSYGFPSGTTAEQVLPVFATATGGDTLDSFSILGALESEVSSLGLSDQGSLVAALQDDIADVSDALKPFLKTPLLDNAAKLPLVDKAKLYVMTTYALESLLFGKKKYSLLALSDSKGRRDLLTFNTQRTWI